MQIKTAAAQTFRNTLNRHMLHYFGYDLVTGGNYPDYESWFMNSSIERDIGRIPFPMTMVQGNPSDMIFLLDVAFTELTGRNLAEAHFYGNQDLTGLPKRSLADWIQGKSISSVLAFIRYFVTQYCTVSDSEEPAPEPAPCKHVLDQEFDFMVEPAPGNDSINAVALIVIALIVTAVIYLFS